MSTLVTAANHKVPPARVRHMFKLLDKDSSGGLSWNEILNGFTKEFATDLSPSVVEKMKACFDTHATSDWLGRKSLSIKVFSRYYAEVLFLHFDRNDDGKLQLAEVEEALAFLVKADGKDGAKPPVVVAYPPEFTDEKGEVHLPIQWFWSFFSAMD